MKILINDYKENHHKRWSFLRINWNKWKFIAYLCFSFILYLKGGYSMKILIHKSLKYSVDDEVIKLENVLMDLSANMIKRKWVF